MKLSVIVEPVVRCQRHICLAVVHKLETGAHILTCTHAVGICRGPGIRGIQDFIPENGISVRIQIIALSFDSPCEQPYHIIVKDMIQEFDGSLRIRHICIYRIVCEHIGGNLIYRLYTLPGRLAVFRIVGPQGSGENLSRRA